MPSPLAATALWRTVMTAAGHRCQCTGGLCGSRHTNSALRCDRTTDSTRLLAAPTDLTLTPAAATALPVEELRAWCPSCHHKATNRQRATTRELQKTPSRRHAVRHLRGPDMARDTEPRIVVICGSTRFMTEMAEADLTETVAGRIVVRPGVDMKSQHPLWADPTDAEALKVRLDRLHRAKIRLAHEALIVGPYIGDSTRAEIAYARSLGIPVRFAHPEVDPDTRGAAT
jgi:hypothetical protein